MAISRRLRFEVLRRDGHTCRYCGAQAPDVKLTVDHVIPVALGGGDEPSNLITACADCNSGKSSVPADAAVVDDVDATALRFARAVEAAAARRRQELADLDKLIDHFDHAVWGGWRSGDDPGEPVPRAAGWRESIERFFAAGLDLDDLTRLVGIAMGANVATTNTWRYFCGCAWREVNRRQEMARRLIEDGEA